MQSVSKSHSALTRLFVPALATSIVIVTLATLTGCSKPKTESPATGKPTIATVNYPLAYFAERIAGDTVTIHFPTISGDPAFWQPKTEDIIAYQQADLILLNGANYAKWVPKVSLAQAKLINTCAKIGNMLILIPHQVTHTHGPKGAHTHGGTAFTTWLDPQLASQQAAAIRDALTAKWPQHAAEFAHGYEALASDLKALDASTTNALAKFGDAPLLGSHPIYQYLTRHYHLNMKSVHWEPDAVPDEAMWRELATLLASHPATVMLWEGEPLAAIKEKLAEKGIKSIIFNPCGNRPATGDYLTVMQQNITNLR